MTDIVLETINVFILAGFIIFLRREGKKRRSVSRKGWNIIFAGFLFLLFGSILDVSDEFPALNHLVVVGDTPVQAFLEKMVGQMMGFLFLTVGLLRWIPTIRTLESNEAALRAAHDGLQDLAGKLISAHEGERRRIAGELHDDLSQRLAALAMETGLLEEQSKHDPKEVARRISRIRSEVAALARDVQGMSHRLHPSILEDLGLRDAVASECSRFAEREGIEVRFPTANIPDTLPREVSLCIYRLIQESLHNVAKHSRAPEVHGSLSQTQDGIHLSIRDNGVGFARQTRGRGGLGLASMGERVRLVHGDFSVQSSPGNGTLVEARIPL